MYELNCIDETFDPNFTTEYKLSIQVSLDGFSFCILDDIRKKHLVFKHFPFLLSNDTFLSKKVKEIIENEEALNKRYKKILISYASPRFTIIPNSLTLPDNKEVFNFNHNFIEDESVKSISVGHFKTNIIFGIPNKTFDFLNTHFKKPEVFHQTKVLSRIISQKIKPEKVISLVSVSKRFFTILITKREKLAFINSYRYTNNMDFIYYLLHIFKSEGISLQETPVYLTGEITEDSHLIEFMKKHFSKVDFLKLARGYQYSYTFSKFPPHMFMTVINPEG